MPTPDGGPRPGVPRSGSPRYRDALTRGFPILLGNFSHPAPRPTQICRILWRSPGWMAPPFKVCHLNPASKVLGARCATLGGGLSRVSDRSDALESRRLARHPPLPGSFGAPSCFHLATGPDARHGLSAGCRWAPVMSLGRAPFAASFSRVRSGPTSPTTPSWPGAVAPASGAIGWHR